MNAIGPMRDPGIAGGVRGDVTVLSAKMKRDVPTLQLLAARGNINAALALKDLVAGNEYARGLQSAAAMQSPEVASVLSQLGQKAEGFQQGPEFPGAPRYAHGGRAFADGAYVDPSGLDWRAGENPLSRAGRRISEAGSEAGSGIVNFLRWLQPRMDRRLPRPAETPQEPTAASEPAAYTPTAADYAAYRTAPAKPSRAAAPATKGGTSAPAGLAAAVTMDDRQPRPSLQGASAAAAAADPATPNAAPNTLLEEFLKQRGQLRAKGSALTQKERELLQQTHDATLRRLSKNSESKMGQLVEWADGILAAQRANPRAKRPLMLAGLGAIEARKAADARQTAIDKATTEFGQKNLLLDAAAHAEEMGDLETAFKYRQQAAKDAIAERRAQTQDRLSEAQTKALIALEKQREAEARARDRKGTGVAAGAGAGAGGAKPLTPAQWLAAVAKRRADLRRQDPLMDPARLEQEAQRLAAADLAAQRTATPAASAPTGGVKFLGYE